MPKPLALSTMYAQQDRFADGAGFARYAAEAGFEAIEISHSTRADKLRQIIESNLLPITSVHQPAPWIRLGDGRGNSKANLASCDESERSQAVGQAIESIRWTAEIGATRSVVHLGAVTDVPEMLAEELEMRRMFDSGCASEPRYEELRLAVIEARAAAAEPHLDAARRSLRQLADVAGRHGITLGIENRYHYHEIPHPEEYDVVLDRLDVEQAGYWHDTGHAEVLHRLGLIDRHAWLSRNADRCVGAHVHDVLGIGDHRAPGDGDVSWGYITSGLGHLPALTIEINQHQPDDRVTATPAFLSDIGFR